MTAEDEVVIRIYAANELTKPISEAKAQIRGLSTTVEESGAKAAVARKEYDSLGLGFGRVHNYATSLVSRLTSMAAVLGPVALGGAIVGAVKLSNEFEAAMMRVHTQAGASTDEVARLSKQVLALAPAVGEGPVPLADALYHVESVGYRGAQAMGILTEAAKAARISGANLDDTTYALTSTMKTYSLDGVTGAAKAMGMLNALVGSGDMRMQDLNKAIQTGIMSTAQTFGVDMQSMGAGLAFLTDRGEKANTASTRLSMGITMMAAPSSIAAKVLTAVGVSAGDIATSSKAMSEALAKAHVTQTRLAHDLKQPDGLYVALTDLKHQLQANGISADASGAIISRVFGGARTGKAVMALWENLDQVKQKYDQIGKQTHAFGDDWKHTQQTTSQRIAQLKSQFESLAITLADKLRPAANRALGAVTGALSNVTQTVQGASKNPHSGLAQGAGYVRSIGSSAGQIWTQIEPALAKIAAILAGGLLVGLHVLADVMHVMSQHGTVLRDVLYAIAIVMAANKAATIILATAQATSNAITFIATLATKGLTVATEESTAAKGGAVIGTRAMNAALNSSLVTLLRTTAALIAQGARWVAYKTLMLAIRVESMAVAAGQKALAAATWLVNTAMDANIIVIVVAALVALGLAIYEAYKHSKTFRDIVNAVGHALAAAGKAVVDFGIRMAHDVVHAFEAVKHAITAAIDWIKQHWRLLVFITASILLGPFGAILALITILIINNFHKIASTVHRIVNDLWHAVVAVWHFIYRDVYSPIARLVRDAIALWTRFRNDVHQGEVWLWRQLVNVWNTIYRDVLAPIGRLTRDAYNLWMFWIRLQVAGVRWLWRQLVNVWNIIYRDVMAPVGRLARDIYNAFQMAEGFVLGIAENLWHRMTQVFGFIRDDVTQAFKDMVQGISTAWSTVENIVAGPVKWIANVAYSDGIEKVWNAVAGILHEKSLKLPDIHFASGGVVPGKHHQDNVPVYTTPGEGILSLHGMGALGNALGMHPHAALHALNGGANNGSSSHFLLGGLPGIGLVKRGLHDVTHNPLTNAVGNVAKSGLDALAHMARGAMAAVAGPILHGIESAADHTLGGMGGMGQLLDKLLHNRIDAFLNWIKGKDSQAPAGGTVQYTPTAGVEQWRGTVLQALQLLGLSPTLADRVLRQMQTESGGNPNIVQGIQDINSATGNLARGLMQVVPTTFAGYHVPGTSNSIYDPLANIAAGLNWDMHKFGGNPGLVDLGQGHGYDIGGYLPHGLSLAYNGLPTSKRELIMPEDVMVAAIRKEMAMAGGGGSTIHIEKLEINNPVDGLDFKKQLKDGIDEWHQERKERKADPRWPS